MTGEHRIDAHAQENISLSVSQTQRGMCLDLAVEAANQRSGNGYAITWEDVLALARWLYNGESGT